MDKKDLLYNVSSTEQTFYIPGISEPISPSSIPIKMHEEFLEEQSASDVIESQDVKTRSEFDYPSQDQVVQVAPKKVKVVTPEHPMLSRGLIPKRLK